MSQKEEPKKPEPKGMPGYAKFMIGGLSGMCATVLTQPMDIIKTRLQVMGVGKGAKYSGWWDCSRTLIKEEGLLAIYSGLSAGLVRQATYTTARLGAYSFFSEKYRQMGGEPNLASRMGLGVAAGVVGAVFGTPADLVLVRMTADGRAPPELRRNYRHVFHAFACIVRDEGPFALWRGCLATTNRAMVVNMCQLGSYSQFKSILINKYNFFDGLLTHFMASMTSGLLTTIASMPFDMAKTRIQNMRIIEGKPEYKGIFDVMVKVTRYEGFFQLWKGFFPYWNRLGPHTVFTFIFMEQYSILYYRFVMKQEYRTSGV